ncbi:hypothetical protein S40285_10194 [Stachybotrys chlorohalonatus IBT 40285]|uniref:Uncharacterized protein n=1 Tax=Stachybotrys chlorohalonatus (strain IBT 40285) TaxID=1283841 RepID=A0A084QUD9_STAC4|nr:hypothetical protein S40285_10194 [Stachybotrys chlorohalonata IBT 40285]
MTERVWLRTDQVRSGQIMGMGMDGIIPAACVEARRQRNEDGELLRFGLMDAHYSAEGAHDQRGLRSFHPPPPPPPPAALLLLFSSIRQSEKESRIPNHSKLKDDHYSGLQAPYRLKLGLSSAGTAWMVGGGPAVFATWRTRMACRFKQAQQATPVLPGKSSLISHHARSLPRSTCTRFHLPSPFLAVRLRSCGLRKVSSPDPPVLGASITSPQPSVKTRFGRRFRFPTFAAVSVAAISASHLRADDSKPALIAQRLRGMNY